MGGTPHWRRRHVELRGLREKATAAERRRCEQLVEAWNKRPSQDWSPTVGAALKAGCAPPAASCCARPLGQSPSRVGRSLIGARRRIA